MPDGLCIALVVFCSTIMWPISRWAMRHQARPVALGLAISATGLFWAIAISVTLRQPLLVPKALLCGGVAGVAYVVGFIFIIFHCLRIGPTGPTVTMNNLGLLWPVVAGMLWPLLKTPTGVQWGGLALTVLALGLTGANRNAGETTAPITPRWVTWALAGWVFAGVSMSCQYVSTTLAPGQYYPFMAAMYGLTFVVCAVTMLLKREARPTRVERLAGVFTATINVAGIAVTMWLLERISPTIVMPITVAGPVVLMLLIGHFLLKERLNGLGWSAGALGVMGIVLLSLK